MSRRHYLVSYDVSDDKRRTLLFKILEGEGDHVQYSVFLCEFNAAELAKVRGRITEIINTRDDQVILLDLGPATAPLGDALEVLGAPYEPLVRTVVV